MKDDYESAILHVAEHCFQSHICPEALPDCEIQTACLHAFYSDESKFFGLSTVLAEDDADDDLRALLIANKDPAEIKDRIVKSVVTFYRKKVVEAIDEQLAIWRDDRMLSTRDARWFEDGEPL